MRLYEFQAKRILDDHDIPIPSHHLITSPLTLQDIRLPTFLKAQVPTGGRGKVGAVRRVDDPETLKSAVRELLGLEVKGHPVSVLLAEEPIEIERELYVACLVDKTTNTPLLMASGSGGVDIEEVADKTPERIIRKNLDPMLGMQGYQVRSLAKALGIKRGKVFEDLVRNMWKLFDNLDATLVEINPLAVTADGFVALDAKIVLDDKARYRHAQLYDALGDEQKELDRRSTTEAQDLAEKAGINYAPLEGDIGVIADGAGTGMLTLDMIHDAGGDPANFCEMGGQSNAAVMEQTMRVVLSDERIKVLLISLIGGLTRMDQMAEGIVRYFDSPGRSVPLAIRMCGTKSDVGIPMLRRTGLDVHEDLATTVRIAVEKSKES